MSVIKQGKPVRYRRDDDKMPIQITEVEKKNIGRCLKLENEQVSVIITVDVGPRVISYALKGMENVLFDGTEKNSHLR